MKQLIQISLLLVSLLGYGQQISKNPKPPAASGVFNLGFDQNMNLIQVPKTGPYSYVKIDAAANKLTAYQSLADVASMTASIVNAPLVINVTDAYRTGSFALSTSDNTSTSDGALTLVTASGLRYKRILLNKQITPQMFGAVGDSLTDDGAALNAWLVAKGAFSHQWTLGKYRSSVSLQRLNKGAVSITTAGSAATRVYFSNDTDGLVITNTANSGGYIQVVGGLTIYSSGTKSVGRSALKLQNQNQQPGVRLDDYVCLQTDADPAKEWTYGLLAVDCISSKFNGITMFGSTLSRMTGIRHTNTSGFRAMNCNYSDVNIQSVMQGVDIEAFGQLSIEGLTFAMTKLVAVRRGFKALSHDYLAPLIDFSGFHIEAYQKDIYVENYAQVNFGSNSLFYMTPVAGITPDDEAIKIVNPQIYNLGNISLFLGCDQTYGINVVGTGTAMQGSVNAICAYGRTNVMHMARDVGNTYFTILRSWTGANGPNSGVKMVDDSNQSTVTGTVDANTITTVQTIDANGTLNANTNGYLRSILIPASEAGKTLNDVALRYEGQIVTLFFDASVTIRHQSGAIFLSGQQNKTLPAKSRITLLRTSQQWEEVSTVLPTAGGGSGYVTTTDYNADFPKLSSPTLTATNSTNSINLTWNSVTDAEKYWLYRGSSLLYSGTALSYVDASVTASTAYTYSLVARGFGVRNSLAATSTITASAPAKTQVVAAGNSLWAGYLSSNTATKNPMAVMQGRLNPTYYGDFNNAAISGQLFADMLSNESSQILNRYDHTTYQNNIALLINAATNSYMNGVSASTLYSNYKAYVQNANATGYKVILSTHSANGKEYGIGAAAGEAVRQQLDQLIREGWKSDIGAAGFVDLAADPIIGVYGHYPSDTFNVDKQHFSDIGYAYEEAKVEPAVVALSSGQTYGKEWLKQNALTASNATSSAVTLTWTAITNATSGYSLYRTTGAIPGSNATPIYNGTNLTYTDNSRDASQAYVYYVRANSTATNNYSTYASTNVAASGSNPASGNIRQWVASSGFSSSGWTDQVASDVATPTGTAPTVTSNSINGLPSIHFSNNALLSNTLTGISGNAPRSMVAVVKVTGTSTSGNAALFGLGGAIVDNTNNTGSICDLIYFGGDLYFHNAGTVTNHLTGVNGTQWAVVGLLFDGNNYTIDWNGLSVSGSGVSTSNLPNSGVLIGQGHYNSAGFNNWTGEIAEIIVRNDANSTAYSQNKAYLKSKYGL